MSRPAPLPSSPCPSPRLPAAAALLVPMLLALGCVPRPTIVTPADLSPVDGPVVPVEIALGGALPAEARLRLTLLAGVDGPSAELRDLSDRLAVAGTSATAELVAEDDLLPGRNTLFVQLDADGDGTAENTSSSTFSWEPELAAAETRRCDVLDPAECLYPFPNDHFTQPDPATDTGLRVQLARESMPANSRGVSIDPTEWNRNDGWSPGPLIQTLVPGLDLEQTGAPPITDVARSLEPDSPVVVVDAVTGERQLLWAELNQNAPPPEQTGQAGRELLIRPAKNLQDGRRYLVALRDLRDAGGERIPASRGFRVYRDRIPTFRPEIEARRPEMERLFDELERAGIAREDLTLAWEFTVLSTRNLSERLLAMRDDAFAGLGDAAPAFSVDEIEERPGDPEVRLRVRGSFEVPLYLTNDGAPGGPTAATRLRCEEPDGSERFCSGDELPVRGGSFTAPFTCVVPRSASPDGGEPVVPARASLYGHGLFGSSGETGASHVRAMAFEHNFVFCGTDWIGMAGEDVPFTVDSTVLNLLNDLSKFPTMADRLHQAMVNFLFLGRLMIHPDGLVSHPAFQGVDEEGAPDPSKPLIDTDGGLYYDGNSQGGIFGGTLLAVAVDHERAVLGVPGMNYSMLLRRSVDFDQFRLVLDYERGIEESLALGLIQMLWDRTDPSGHANHMTRDPYPGTPPDKKALLHVAYSDFQVTNWAAEIQARTLGAPAHAPLVDPDNPPERSHPAEDPLFGIGAIPGHPWDGSAYVLWDSGNLSPPTENRPSRPLSNPSANPGYTECALRFGQDPHECPRRQPAARLQKSEFLRPDGAVIDVCGGEACQAPLR